MKKEKVASKALEEDLLAGKKIREMLDAENDPTLHTKEELEEINKRGQEAIDFLFNKYKCYADERAWNFKTMSGTVYSIEDIRQDSYSILLNGMYSYDYTKGCKFSTHVFQLFRRDLPRLNQTTVRVPAHVLEQYAIVSKFSKDYIQLSDDEKETVSEEEYIASLTGHKVEKVRELLNIFNYSVSLNSTYQDTGLEAINLIEDNSTDKRFKKEATELLLSCLNDFEKTLLFYEYEIGEEQDLSFAEFMVKYELTDKKVKSELTRIKKKMLKFAEERGISSAD